MCDKNFWGVVSNFVTTEYNWFLFSIGEVLILIAVFLFIR
ncbi:hypothetical protein CSE_02800 [Caldisericum exile AZM16c01]|uniref:Uncharacterized protein n=1 Tax=Caldisericum exile (strain DSM 21853 / NBRC 104410 / AZM16c01) TaxID=511051 RepID=A0A7U6JE64_CALEA|nr:hypothetical protein CSE_02800 [Caldisericum exile AZM16c01]